MAPNTHNELDPSIQPAEESALNQNKDVSIEDETLLLLAGLMEPGKDDEDLCKELAKLTRFLTEDPSIDPRMSQPHKPLHQILDEDTIDTILGFLDMRQAPSVRGYATMAVSEYLKQSGEVGNKQLSEFFYGKVRRSTYDDFINAFSVAAQIFPVIPDLASTLFLSEGFVGSLGPLMKRKWKSKKVEQSALEMLNVACMNTACREAIKKYCTEWLEEVVNAPPPSGNGLPVNEDGGAIEQRIHSEKVKNMAAVVLAKIQAVPSAPDPGSEEERIQPAMTSVEDLSDLFKSLLGSEGSQHSSIEGLAYTSLQSNIKEKLANDKSFLQQLIKALKEAPAKSPTTYGALSILVNLTIYMPTLSEEQKKMTQLKAYANASKSPAATDPLNNDVHVSERCKAVFEAGAIPVLVTHSQHGSTASLSLVVSIISSLSRNQKIRGQMAQQGAIKLLLHAYPLFPSSHASAQRTTAHALARILISTNPMHVFGGSNPLSITSAIRPLLSLLQEDTISEQRDLLPTFESLLALTNLASTDDSTRQAILRLCFPTIEDLLLSQNALVQRASAELICNLTLSPQGVALFADGSKQASQRLHVLLALSDAEDFETRRAAGGALAGLSEWDSAVDAILKIEGGVRLLLGLCKEDKEELKHRGVVCVLNVVSAPGEIGERGVEAVADEGGVDVLKDVLKSTRNQEILELAVESLKRVLEGEQAGGKLVKG